MGANPDWRSALRRTEVVAGASVARTGIADTADARLGARFTADTLTAGARWGVTRHAIDKTDSWSLQNVEVGVGYRSLKTDLGGLYRRGIAFHADVSLDVEQIGDEHDRHLEVEADLVRARPFDLMRFAPSQHFQSMVEARYELIGCHAPFIHMQAGTRARKDLDAPSWAFPASVLVGAHTSPSWTIFGEYSVLATRYPELAHDDGYRALSRLRGGVGIAVGPSGRVDVYVDAIIGQRDITTTTPVAVTADLTLPLGD